MPKQSCPTKSYSCDRGSQTTPAQPKCSTGQAEIKGHIHGRSFMHLFWPSSDLSQMYFCCIFIHLLNIILRPGVQSWDWRSQCCCCCCCNRVLQGFDLQESFQCFLGMWNQKAEERQWKSYIFLGIGAGGVTWRSSPILSTSWRQHWKTQNQKLNHCCWGRLFLLFCPFRAIARASAPEKP